MDTANGSAVAMLADLGYHAAVQYIVSSGTVNTVLERAIDTTLHVDHIQLVFVSL